MHHLSTPSDAAALAARVRVASDYAAILALRDSHKRAMQRLSQRER